MLLNLFALRFRLNSLSTAEGNKTQLMQDLEAKLVAANTAKQGLDANISSFSTLW